MESIRFWAAMARCVVLPAAFSLAVLLAPLVLMPKPVALGYLLFVGAALSRVVWRTVVNNDPPSILRRFGW